MATKTSKTAAKRKIIFVANYSGNVGKTTFVDNCLLPRLHNPTHVPIETINSNNRDSSVNVEGSKFNDITIALAGVAPTDDVVIDVGSSNVETVFQEMRRGDSSDDFDYFLIPVVPVKKQIEDTATIIKDLADMGVPPEKIVVVFNIVPRGKTVDSAFGYLVKFHAAEGLFTLIDDAVISESDIFDKIKGKTTIDKVIADERDFNALIAAEPDHDARVALAHERSLKRIAAKVNNNLDDVFNAIFA